MNTSVISNSTESWSRRVSTESIWSIQNKETDFVVDSSDTEVYSDQDVEYEPFTEPEDAAPPLLGQLEDSSGESGNEIIATKVIEVSVRDDGDLEFADSERTDSDEFDSEVDLCDYWCCVQCGASNNNPMYRYCEKCYKVRKNFFPPRPKRKNKRRLFERKNKRPLSPDSGSDDEKRGHDRLPSLPLTRDVRSPLDLPNAEQSPTEDKELGLSQEPAALSQLSYSQRALSQDSGFGSQELTDPQPGCSNSPQVTVKRLGSIKTGKRRSESLDRSAKRTRLDLNVSSDSDSDSKAVSPLIKTTSDPSLTVEEVKATNTDAAKEIDKDNDLCMVCLSEPKSGLFVHGRIAHTCCCYKCAKKVWAMAKRCPLCNRKVSNVTKLVAM